MKMKKFKKLVYGIYKGYLYKKNPLCKEIDRRVSLSWVISRSALSTKYKYIYFRIPKCANSTILKTLVFYDAFKTYIHDDYDGKASKKQFDNYIMSDIKCLDLLKKNYFLFTFVRNPYTRVLSAYLDKICNSVNPKYIKVKKQISIISNSEDTSFADFIAYLEKGGLYEDPHWVPQVAMIPVSYSRLDYVGQVENIENDLKVVIATIFGGDVFKGIKERTHNRRHASRQLKDYYNSSLANRVAALYREDFLAFNYPFDLPGNSKIL